MSKTFNKDFYSRTNYKVNEDTLKLETDETQRILEWIEKVNEEDKVGLFF